MSIHRNGYEEYYYISLLIFLDNNREKSNEKIMSNSFALLIFFSINLFGPNFISLHKNKDEKKFRANLQYKTLSVFTVAAAASWRRIAYQFYESNIEHIHISIIYLEYDLLNNKCNIPFNSDYTLFCEFVCALNVCIIIIYDAIVFGRMSISQTTSLNRNRISLCNFFTFVRNSEIVEL